MALLDDTGKPGDSSRGELGLAGPQVTSGYLKNSEETCNAFSGKWFKTGDVVEVDEDGFLCVVDRKKDMIKTGGFNVYPSEVEQVLYRHPGIHFCKPGKSGISPSLRESMDKIEGTSDTNCQDADRRV